MLGAVQTLLLGVCYTFFYCAVLFAFLIAVFALFIIHERRKYRHVPGPPNKSFFSGNIHDFVDPKLTEKDRHKYFIQLGKDYGPLVKLTALHKVILFATTPDFAREILTNSKYTKPREIYESLVSVFGVPFLGNSIVTIIDYKEWKFRRHALNPTFHRSFLEKLIPVFNKTADLMVEELEVKAQGGELVSMLEVFGRATLDAICQIAFSFDLRETEGVGSRSLLHDLRVTADAFTAYNYNRALRFSFKERHRVRKYREALWGVRQSMEKVLDKRLDELKEGHETPRDILSIMLEGLGTHCCREDLVSEMVTMLEAGQETSAAALSSLMMELSRHPDYVRTLREEIMSVVGDKNMIEVEDLDQLHWTAAVLKETLRLYPPAQGTTRKVPEDIVLSGFKIYKGTIVLVNFTAIHYLHHEDGANFRPEKWLPENKPRTNFNFLPFSLGQRSCIGRQFAWMESKILLAKFFRRYNFHLDPSEAFHMKESLTMRPTSGVIGQVSFERD